MLLVQPAYRIQPNYRTVRLGFSEMLGKLVVKYIPTYTKGTLKKKKKKNAMFLYVCIFFFFFFFVFDFPCKAYVVGTHLNCIDKLMQFK